MHPDFQQCTDCCKRRGILVEFAALLPGLRSVCMAPTTYMAVFVAVSESDSSAWMSPVDLLKVNSVDAADAAA